MSDFRENLKTIASGRWFKFILFAWCILLIILKNPTLFFIPRFWAEEGTVFLSFAHTSSFWEFLTTPLIGYYTLLNVLAGYLSDRLVPIDYAPFVTIYMGCIIQFIPVAIIIFTHHVFWDHGYKKAMIASLVILITPGELWLNTTNSHFLLGLTSFLIIVSTPPSGLFGKWILRIILVLAALSGPEASFFVPVLLLKTWRERSRENIIRSVLLTVCALFQFCIIVYSALYNNHYHRFEGFEAVNFVLRYFRDGFGMLLPVGLNDRKNIGILMTVYTIWLFSRNYRDNDFQYFILGFFLIGFFSIVGSLGMLGGTRYSYIPSVLLMAMITAELTLFSRLESARFRIAFAIVVVSFTFLFTFYQKQLDSCMDPDFPQWKTEVEKWKKDNSYRIQISPTREDEKWEIDLRGK